MFFRLIRYIGYLVFSRHRTGHGIHSPFVFDLVSRVMRNKTDSDIVLKIESIRNKNLSDDRVISIQDPGAGSSKMKGNSRRVSDIIKYSAVPAKYGRLLFNMASEFGKPGIVEFGTSLGISTLYLAAACPDSMVYTVEGCSATAEIAAANFKSYGTSNITLIQESFDTAISDLITKSVKPGLVFIDGHHRKEPTLRYFELMAGHCDKGTVIMIDDIHSSGEMEEAWSLIKKNKEVTVTIDIFRMGLVFFREGMSSFDYLIRY
jgi:predicted O-methyltransferase YrrM